jgi:serine/threonine protein kinase
LLLCDFGGSTCDELGLDGGCLPDGPFYHPSFGLKSTPALDIFGLGSLFYTILTGHWPYRSSSGSPQTIDERVAYEKEVVEAFNQEKYPDLTRVVGGSVILACWKKQYSTAEEVLHALQREMPISEDETDVKLADHTSILLRVAIPVAVLIVSTFVYLRRRPR